MNLRVAVVIMGLMVTVQHPAHAENRDDASCSRLNRSNLVPCVLSASLTVQAEGDQLEAARGRHTSANAILPSNPVLQISGARRTNGSSNANNWYVTVGQEIEIAGQRGARRDAAAASVAAQRERVAISRRNVAVQAWLLFFEGLAASEEQKLAARLAEVAQRVSTVARARADQRPRGARGSRCGSGDDHHRFHFESGR